MMVKVIRDGGAESQVNNMRMVNPVLSIIVQNPVLCPDGLPSRPRVATMGSSFCETAFMTIGLFPVILTEIGSGRISPFPSMPAIIFASFIGKTEVCLMDMTEASFFWTIMIVHSHLSGNMKVAPVIRFIGRAPMAMKTVKDQKALLIQLLTECYR